MEMQCRGCGTRSDSRYYYRCTDCNGMFCRSCLTSDGLMMKFAAGFVPQLLGRCPDCFNKDDLAKGTVREIYDPNH